METMLKRQFSGADYQRVVSTKNGNSPPVYLEYVWYLNLAYALLGEAWGVVIPVVGGALLIFLTIACVHSVRSRVLQVYEPTRWALLTGILIVCISYTAYSEQSFAASIGFLGWICNMLIAQALALRSGFLRRFAWAAFAIGVGALPLVTLRGAGATARAWGSGGISNPNVLGMWFGFCVIYFLFAELQSRQVSRKAISWTLAIGCLFVVLLTVSRGALLGVIVACLVGFGSTVRRFFMPILFLVLVLLGVYASGVFDRLIDQYMTRGAEDSGREILWPAALERISASPWVGVGLDNIRIRYREKNRFVNPHNAFLHIALAAGIVPLICYLGYLARVGGGCLYLMRRSNFTDALLLPPLVTFGAIQILVADYNFMSAWVVVTFGLSAVNRTSQNLL